MEQARLDTLLSAYTAERADEAQAVASMIALLATIIGLLSLIGFALSNRSTPGWVIALAPIPPIPFIAFGALLSHLANVRGVVIDDYERELGALVPAAPGEKNLIPYGHRVVNRWVWHAPYGWIVLGVSFVSMLGIYIGVIIESFRYSKGDEFVLALTGLVTSSVATMIFLGLYATALCPKRVVNRARAKMI